MEVNEIVRAWRRHRRGFQSLDMMLESNRLRDLDQTPTLEDSLVTAMVEESFKDIRSRCTRKRGKSF